MGGYDTANGHVALRSLESRGVIEEVPGERPIRWRLAGRYRATADPYLAIAEQVRQGEWTTYGDISVAVRGDTNGARAVGRAAAMLEHFPNPHRVLQSGGRIPPGWKSTESEEPNPDECRRRLEIEGVDFDEHGRASRRQYVAWDVLVERAEERQAA
jgi:alkylated DNA nucleotide flippase Atl1